MIGIGILTMSSYEEAAKNAVESIECGVDDFHIGLIDNGGKLGIDNLDILHKTSVSYIGTPRENLGIAGGWNVLLRYFFNDKEYRFSPINEVVLVNDDAVLYPGCIDFLINGIRKENYGIISAYQVKGNSATALTPRYIPGMHFSTFAITRECVEKVGMFDEKFYPCYVEDTDYYTRLLNQDEIKYGTDRWALFKHNRKISRQEPWVVASHRKNRAYYKQKWGESPKRVFKIMSEGRGCL
jgi:GT2 family glycosyltransferase